MSFNPEATNLSGMTDVSLSNPQNSQVLTYDDGVDKWQNQAATAQAASVMYDAGWPERPAAALVFWVGGGAGDQPAGMLAGDIWLQDADVEVGGPAALLSWAGVGLSDESTLAIGSAGTGDSPLSGIRGTAATVETGETVTPAFECAQGAGVSSGVYWILSDAQAAARLRFYFKTPAAWGASAMPIANIRGAIEAATRFEVVIGGTGAPGRIRVHDASSTQVVASPENTMATSTWYRVEVGFDMAVGTLRLYLYNLAGTLLYDTNGLTSFPFSASNFQRVYIGQFNISPTLTMLYGHVRLTDDPATTIGVY